MPSDRHRRRAVFLAAGIVFSTISSGCLTSSLRRGADAPASASEPPTVARDVPGEGRDAQNRVHPGRTDSSVRNASVQASDAPLGGVAIATPFLTTPVPSSPAPAGAFPLELQAVPTESPGNGRPGRSGPPTSAPSAQPAVPASTPLLDAAIQRVADITRQQREAIAASPTPEPEEEQKKQPQVRAPFPARQSAISQRQAPDQLIGNSEAVPLPAQLSPKIDENQVPAVPAPAQPTPGAVAPVAAAASLAATTADPKVAIAAPPYRPETADANLKLSPLLAPEAKDYPDPEAIETRGADAATSRDGGSSFDLETPDPAQQSPLGISELRLCRKVFGFGSFEPLVDDRVKVGQHLLVYCELTGLQYEVRDGDFASRISSRVEVKPAAGGPVLWKRELGDAEDVCRRRRRDYYVNYRVELPKSLGPGSYRLRLLQTDLIAGCSTSADIPLEITR
jgi:hypothetical protein